MPDEGRTPLRVFCAVELPDEIRSRVAERIRRLRAEFSDVRASWEKPEKLHVTLKRRPLARSRISNPSN